jgi:hypothetical protein
VEGQASKAFLAPFIFIIKTSSTVSLSFLTRILWSKTIVTAYNVSKRFMNLNANGKCTIIYFPKKSHSKVIVYIIHTRGS